MDELTHDELTVLASLLANANVVVKDAKPAQELLAKLERMRDGKRSQESNTKNKAQTIPTAKTREAVGKSNGVSQS